VERRISDSRVAGLLAAIHDGPTGIRLAAERAFLRRLDGSCETPIAGLAVLDGGRVHLRGEILRPDGSEAIAGDLRGTATDAADLGETLAQQLLDRAPKGFFGHTG
jgi:hydroxymethylbilane synthase